MIRGLLGQIEQLWYVPIRLSPRSNAWAASYWWCRRLAQGRGTLRRYVINHEGRQLQLATVGHYERTAAFCESLLGEVELTSEEGTLSVATPVGFDAIDADLLVVEIQPHLAPAFRASGWITIPAWIRWCGELASMSPRNSRSLKSDLKKVQAYSYTLEPAGTRDDWNEFYDEMVAPYAKQRFDDFAWVPGDLFRGLLRRRGQLHFVRRDGRRVAAFAALTGQQQAWFPLLGTLPDPGLVRDGVLAAIYVFTFDWARAHGLTHADVGRSSAWVSDGIGRYKEKWGLQPTPDPVSHLLAVRPGAVERSLFAQAPAYMALDNGLQIYAGVPS